MQEEECGEIYDSIYLYFRSIYNGHVHVYAYIISIKIHKV